MPVWVWVLIAVGAVLLIACAAWALLSKRRSMELQSRFGPEYDRTVERSSNKREAEAELVERQRRREQFEIRPLTASARTRYAERWQQVQADFVDSPSTSVTAADALVTEVMRERGYPMDDFEQRSADVSVDHPEVVESYRQGHRLAQRSANGDASTEDLRQALQHYRRLFDELLEPAADEPVAGERDVDERNEAEIPAATDGRVRQ
jgi:hypothetical protein